MEYHEAANIFPLMTDEEIADLAEDIKVNGLQLPVETLDGKIIDGRNRWRACELAGVEADVVSVEKSDPISYVLSLNLHRRQLTIPQRAIAAAKADNFREAAKERMLAGKKSDPPANLPEGSRDARDEAGKAFGVSGKSVDSAAKVLRQGSEELIGALETGEIAVSKAAKLAELPKKKQVDAIKAGKEGITKALKTEVEKTMPRTKPKPISPLAKKGIRMAISALSRALDVVGLLPKYENFLSEIEQDIKRK